MGNKTQYLPGDLIGNQYEVFQAHAGGMGEVYLCLDRQEELPYALKTFKKQFLSYPKLRKVFENEATLWSQLELHPNIVHCHYALEIDNQPFMFLEWVFGDASKGTSLREWMMHGPIGIHKAIDFAIDIAHGLQYANSKIPGIIHLDLKPENILISHDHLAKITDFGLAKIIKQAEIKITLTKNQPLIPNETLINAGIVGTPQYMSPEQWRGEPLDVRTDIYALGCIIFELLTGHRPFQANTLAGLQQAHCEAEIPNLPESVNTNALEVLVKKSLAKDLLKRFTNVDEFLDMLEEAYLEILGTSPKKNFRAKELSATDLNNRAVTFHYLGKHDLALADANRAIEVFPEYVKGLNTRGITLEALGRVEDALSDFDLAIQYDSLYAVPYSNRARILANLGHFQEALNDHNRAIELEPYFSLHYLARGQSLQKMGQLKNAVSDFSQAIQLNPALSDAYQLRGYAFLELKEYQQALLDFNDAISLDPTSVANYSGRGKVYFSVDRFFEALEDFNKALALNPSIANTYSIRGATYRQLKKIRDAIADYLRAVDLDPNLAEVHILLGNAYRDIKQYDEALKSYKNALQIHPNHGGAYIALGITYRDIGDFTAAIEAFSKAIEIDSNDYQPFHNRGDLLYEMGQMDDALEDLNQAISLKPELAISFVTRGAVYAALDRLDDAQKDLEQALRLDPTNAKAHFNLGGVLVRSHRLSQALGHFEKASDLGFLLGAQYAEKVKLMTNLDEIPSISTSTPGSTQYQHVINRINEGEKNLQLTAIKKLRLGVTLGNMRQFRDAIIALSEAIELGANLDSSFLSNAYSMRGKALSDTGQFQKAIDDLTHAITLDPTNSENFNLRGRIYGIMQQYSQAINDYSTSIQQNPNDANILNNRGYTYRVIGQLHEALVDYNRSIELDPHNAMTFANRGDTLAALNMFEEAEQDFARAIEINPNFTLSYLHRSQAYAERGMWELAIKDLHYVITIDPDDPSAYLSLGIIFGKADKEMEALSYFEKAAHLGSSEGAKYATYIKTRHQEQIKQKDPTQEAFAAFQTTQSLKDMRIAIEKNPIMVTDIFIEGVRKAIEQIVPIELRPQFRRQFEWLQHLAQQPHIKKSNRF